MKRPKHCPHCLEKHIVKNGHARGKPRWKCQSCGKQFTRITDRGYSENTKLTWVLMYQWGVSLSAIAGIYKTHPSTVMRWISKNVPGYPLQRRKRGVTIMKLDRMLDHLHKERRAKEEDSRYGGGYGMLWIGISVGSLNENIAVTDYY